MSLLSLSGGGEKVSGGDGVIKNLPPSITTGPVVMGRKKK
jgi:hypothetical protein